MSRKPGRSKLVYDERTKTIKKVKFNFWKRLIWNLWKEGKNEYKIK